MIRNYNKKNQKINAIISVIIIVVVFWLLTPPVNKFVQLCYWGSNVYMTVSKIFGNENSKEYVFRRNNAVYLAKMNDMKASIVEINKAIDLVPNYASSNEMDEFFKDRARIYLIAKRYDDALSDYTRCANLDIFDSVRVAMLFKKKGNLKYAGKYCNNVISENPDLYLGYACLADVYSAANRDDVSIRLMDLLLDKTSNRAQYYLDRAYYKYRVGDTAGAYQDELAAEKLSPNYKRVPIMEQVLDPKSITFKIL